MNKILPMLCVLWPFTVLSEGNDVLSVERSISNNIKLSFPNEKNIMPKLSDFEIENYVLMSSENGDRWAVITLVNLSSGARELEHDHLMALFADGNRLSPIDYKINFKGNETQTVTISFGHSKFPILSIYSSN